MRGAILIVISMYTDTNCVHWLYYVYFRSYLFFESHFSILLSVRALSSRSVFWSNVFMNKFVVNPNTFDSYFLKGNFSFYIQNLKFYQKKWPVEVVFWIHNVVGSITPRHWNVDCWKECAFSLMFVSSLFRLMLK